jgi:hypothetical protein
VRRSRPALIVVDHVPKGGPGKGNGEGVGVMSREIILREQVRRYAAGDKLLSVVDLKKGCQVSLPALLAARVELGEAVEKLASFDERLHPDALVEAVRVARGAVAEHP